MHIKLLLSVLFLLNSFNYYTSYLRVLIHSIFSAFIMGDHALTALSATARRRNLNICSDQHLDPLAPVLAKLSFLEKVVDTQTKLLREVLRRLPPPAEFESSELDHDPRSFSSSFNCSVPALKALNGKLSSSSSKEECQHSNNSTAASPPSLSPCGQCNKEKETSEERLTCHKRLHAETSPANIAEYETPLLIRGEEQQPTKARISASSSATSCSPSSSQLNNNNAREAKKAFTPPPCQWLSLRDIRLAKHRSIRELDASPAVSACAPERPTVGPFGSPLIEVQRYGEGWTATTRCPLLSSSGVRAAAAAPAASGAIYKKIDMTHAANACTETEADSCLICLLPKSESMHLAKPTLFRLTCGHEFHLHCLAEVLQRRHCRKECAVCICPIEEKEGLLIREQSKREKKQTNIVVYQQQLFEAIAQVETTQQ